MDEIKIALDWKHTESLPVQDLVQEARAARETLERGSGAGSEFLGWRDLPAGMEDAELEAILEAATHIRKQQALVVVGIGGSYLGARAVIEALRSPFDDGAFPIYFAGHQMDASYHAGLLRRLRGLRYAVNVISKSGTTTEPGLAFRLLMNDLRERYSSPELKQLLFMTTDAKKGGLRKMADADGLRAFVIPDDVGGRFSVFTPVGLLPIAAAGIDIKELLRGARDMAARLKASDDFEANPALAYACFRNAAYRAGRKVEIMQSYTSGLHYTAEWWKQLFGESEGKDGKGIFPAAVDLSTDLHSMGQWIQDGERIIFGTVLDVLSAESPRVPKQDDDADGLNYLAGKSLHEINRVALAATMAAHEEGGVPGLRIEVPELNAYNMGALLYMFEYACGVSAYMLGVNPFDQPGVEAYKTSMFRMLGKPGY